MELGCFISVPGFRILVGVYHDVCILTRHVGICTKQEFRWISMVLYLQKKRSKSSAVMKKVRLHNVTDVVKNWSILKVSART